MQIPNLKTLEKKIETAFLKKDLEGNGISQQDYDIEDKINLATMRASAIGRWARNDLDGDGRVTRNEYRIMFSRRVPRTLRFGREQVETTPEQRTKLTAKSVDKEMKADIDEDGSISIQEAIASSKVSNKKLARFSPLYNKLRRIPPSFDKNQDGKITLNEFTTVTNKLLKRLDTDRNGVLDREEYRYYRQLSRRANKALLRNNRRDLLKK